MMTGNQKPRNHEEHVDADETARRGLWEGVKIQHQNHGDGPEAVDVGPILHGRPDLETRTGSRLECRLRRRLL